MDTLKIKNKGNCRIIAHRGTRLEIENTLGAFIASCNRSYFGIETDVYKTKDGRYILAHDENTARIAEENLVIEESTFEQLRSLKYRTGGRYSRKDIVMPSLEEYLDICKNYDKICVIELKKQIGDDSIEEICDIIKKMYSLDKVMFISFDFPTLLTIRRLYPNQRIQFLIDATASTIDDKFANGRFEYTASDFASNEDKVLFMLDTLKKYGFGLDVWDKSVTQQLVDDCHSRGIEVNVFTPNTEQEAQEFIAMGVDFITSDICE